MASDRLLRPRVTAARLAPLAALAALAAFPAVAEPFYLQQFARIMIMAIFAMSLDLLVGYAGLVSFGHAAFFGLGAYALWYVSPQYAAASLWSSLPVAVGVAALAAFAIGLLVLRAGGVYFIMATLAFAQMFYFYVTGSKAMGGSDGVYVYVKPDATVFGFTPFDLGDKLQFYYVILALMAGTYAFLAVILDAPFGRVVQGIRSNEGRMRALGFATYRYKLAAFVLAGALAGLAGYFDAAQYGFVNPELFGWRLSGIVLMMVILGGMGTLYGAVLGAFALTLLEDALSGASRHWLLPMGIIIILAVLLLPKGFAGLGEVLRRRPAAEPADD